MEMTGLQCSGCGSTLVTFDTKRRMLICNMCGKEEYYSRATLNANGKVLLSKDNAIKFFKNGNYESAQHYALEILNISQDNVPALFIIAYYNEFCMKRENSIRDFYVKIKEISLEYKEVRDLKELFLVAAYNLQEFEEEMLVLLALNMQSSDDVSELEEFVDKISPYYISKRTSMNYMSESMAGVYADFAEHCGIPKTVYALVKSIKTNPDSPFVGDAFYLSIKTKFFYDNYVIPIGNILSKMKNDTYKSKIMPMYESLKKEYELKAGY